MGTRSKMDINDRCTVRQPMNGQQFSDDLAVLANPRSFNRDMRLASRSRLRRHAKYLQTHVPKTQRSPVEQEFIDAAGRWL